ncbi:SHOCT domain-containing protein, partial [Streptomyces shenzhenensis]
AVRARGPVAAVPAPRPARPRPRDPADIAERIRHLGELHRAGLVTDEEFAVKKAELLAEL